MKISRVKIYCKLKYFFFSFFLNTEKVKKKIKEKLSFQTKKKYIEFFGMCRTCFIVILEYLIKYKPTKNEILVCSYNLEEMIEIAKIYNFKVKLIDIDLKTGVMDSKIIENNISDKTAAILFTNMFNNYTELHNLKNIAEKNGILLVEDNAIYLGNYYEDQNNKIYSGSFGDVSIFSFGIMKNISAIFGGALLTSNVDIYNFAKEKNNSFQNFPLNLYFKKFLLFLTLKLFLSKIIYNFFFFYIIKFAHNYKIKFLLKLIYPSLNFRLKKSITPEYKSKISNLSLKIIYQILNDPDFEKDRKKRRDNNFLYHKLLRENLNINQIELFDKDFQNFLDYPIIIKKNKDKLVEFLFKKGLETRYHFYSNFEKYINLDNNKVSRYFDENLICLPSHSEIDEKKIKKYCDEINNFYLNE